jgi:uncharacterized protein (TIGR02452 family)
MKKTREELMQVYDSTMEIIQTGGYEDNNGTWHALTNPLKSSRFYSTLSTLKDEFPVFEEKVYVENIDTFQKAMSLGPKAAVLNMASFQRPGGGVKNGSRAQEEDLCRRSNLLQALYAFSADGCEELGYEPLKRLKYPIPMFGGIYSPHVLVFKNALSYSLMDKPFETNVISVAGIKHPTLDKKTGMLQDKDATAMKGKIRAILRIALLNKHTKLVLGALGCGAYGNPPVHVAQLFHEVIHEEEFWGHFEEICFAVLEDGNSLKNQSGGNFKPFKEVFG